MPKKLFNELYEDKRSRIFKAALEEFAEYSYNDSSTNSIIKKAGISKGSLFKYFHNKEDLYFYILDSSINNMIEILGKQALSFSGDIFEIIIQYSELEFQWHIENPEQYKLLKNAFTDNCSEIYRKTEERYDIIGNSFYNNLFENANIEQLRSTKDKTLTILRHFLKGFNEEFTKSIPMDENLNKIKKEYSKQLKEYMKILKDGIYK